jgi:hypothetical protein
MRKWGGAGETLANAHGALARATTVAITAASLALLAGTGCGGAPEGGELAPVLTPGAGGAGGLAGSGGRADAAPAPGAGGSGVPGCGCAAPAPPPTAMWAEVSEPADVTSARITDAFAAGPDDLFFAGMAGNFGTGSPSVFILRFSHGCWTVELSVPATNPRPSVHGTGPTDVWAALGDAVYHRDAAGWSAFDNSWRDQVTSRPFGDPIGLTRVRAAGPTDVWVTERRHILHHDRGIWTVLNLDDPDYPQAGASIGFLFSDIWIDGPADVWIAGGSDQVGNTMDPAFIHHFDGATWTKLGVGRFDVHALWRSGPSLWLAFPEQAVQVNGQWLPTTLSRFDGAPPITSVLVAGAPSVGSLSLTSLWGRAADDLWAAGEDVAHYDGQGWTLDADAPAAARSSTDFENTIVTGDGETVWLATAGPRFFRKRAGP